MKKDLNKMSKEEIKAYYEKRAYVIGAAFAFALLLVAIVGFLLGFNGPELLK